MAEANSTLGARTTAHQPFVYSGDCQHEARLPIDAIDRLDWSIKAAGSLCQVTYGEQGESFRCLNDEMQDNIMAILAEKIDLISEAWIEVKSALRAQKETT